MDKTPIQVQLNIEGVTNSLFGLLNECQNVILFGLRIIDDLHTFPKEMIEEFKMSPIRIGDAKKSIDDQKKCLKNGY